MQRCMHRTTWQDASICAAVCTKPQHRARSRTTACTLPAMHGPIPRSRSAPASVSVSLPYKQVQAQVRPMGLTDKLGAARDARRAWPLRRRDRGLGPGVAPVWK